MSELNIALTAITAVILFLFGLENFSKEIQRISGERFRLFLAKATKIPVVGVIIGALVTSIIQSSSATSVITMGLVNAGVISFKNSLGIIFGANIGTTVTAQLIAFKLTNFAPYIIILGFLLSIFRSRYSFIGKAIFYFGFVFLSLNLISQAVMPLQEDPRFLSILTAPKNVFTSVMIGALFTAIVQSSSVTTGLAVIFTQSGLLTFENAIPIVMGANIGTTITAILAIFNMDIPAKRTAISHLIFNIGGVLIFLPFLGIMRDSFQNLNPAVALANIHLLFNLISTIVFTIFISPFEKFIRFIFPSENAGELPRFEFPNLKNEFEFEAVDKFIQTGFDNLFSILKDNYNFITLSIESNYRHIFDKVAKRIQFFDMIQKDFTRFFADLINRTNEETSSEKIIVYITEFEYLYQIHDSLKDIMQIKIYMDEMFIEMHTDMLRHYREISSKTLNIFELLDRKITHKDVDDNIVNEEFRALQLLLNDYSRTLFKIMPDTNRNDTGNNLHFMTYSQRLKDKLQNLFDLLKSRL